MKRIYVDSNVLIALFSTDLHESANRKLAENAVDAFAQVRNAQLWTSMWAITEMVNILVSAKKVDPGYVAELENRLISEKRLRRVKLHLADVSPDEEYDFPEFFYHVRQGILEYHSGVGDVIHSVIMKNNGITDILTFDEKSDFKQIPGLTVMHPRAIKI